MASPMLTRNAIFATGNRHCLIVAIVITLMYTWVSLLQPIGLQVSVNTKQVLHCVDEKFLSLAIDTSFIRKSIKRMTKEDWQKMIEIAKPFSPAYLRLGGTDADRLIFKEKLQSSDVVLTPKDWILINDFVNNANLKLLFNFNVLLRISDSWDSANAQAILQFSKFIHLKADYQLGNEPNSFPHVFNVNVSPEQLGEDFSVLRDVLDSDEFSSDSLLVGPDVTRPKDLDLPSVPFLKQFLKVSLGSLDAVSWHQYYLNGREATLSDFLSPLVMERLRFQINSIREVIRNFSSDIPIWLTETGSASGGGAPELSNRYVSTFLFLDKLGLSAQLGISMVIRQSLYQGHYAMVDDDFNPYPDFWISLTYKKLVGLNVYNVSFRRENKLVRIYAHSVQESVNCLRVPHHNSSFVVFGINLGSESEILEFIADKPLIHCASYVFTAVNNDMQSLWIQLNGNLLDWNETRFHLDSFLNEFASFDDLAVLPAYSLGFWVFS